MMVDPRDLLWLGLVILLIPFVFGAVGLLIDLSTTDPSTDGRGDDA
jgi:hypothetical protein